MTLLQKVVEAESGGLTFATLGAGRGLLVPWCNLPWPELPLIDRLAESYRVVLASPRGYQQSSRLGAGEEYCAADTVQDLLDVCDAVGLDEFSVFGYSLSAAVGAWLACTSSRVTHAVLGGFPLLGSYRLVSESAERDAEQLQADPGFDSRAALAFYRELADLPDGALVDHRRCRLHAFWGSDDTVLQTFNGERDLANALAGRGVDASVIDGADHLTTLFDTAGVMKVLEAAGR